MKEIKSYRDLLVWQKAMDLAEKIYKSTSDFPKSEIYTLTSQMRRAAVSIVSNIAEGRGRDSILEYIHFLSIACGSLTELETQIMLSAKLTYLKEEQATHLLSLCDEIGRMLGVLRRKLKDRAETNT
ncbi:MAG: four helix bundle protein [Candidatus Cloacimonetes bacterium]|nr:four helix bundle protein [Candidatus Cloacimonadota bacterium]